MYCCPLWFNSTSSSIKKLKWSYNSVLRRLLCIRMPYSASAMFVTHGIPSFYELLRKCINNFSERISSSSNSISHNSDYNIGTFCEIVLSCI